jgi:hypothetical protein
LVSFHVFEVALGSIVSPDSLRYPRFWNASLKPEKSYVAADLASRESLMLARLKFGLTNSGCFAPMSTDDALIKLTR